MNTKNKQLKKMIAMRMAIRAHGTFRPNNPNKKKEIAQKWFEAKKNKKKLPTDKPTPSNRPSYRQNDPYRHLSIEEFEKKYL